MTNPPATCPACGAGLRQPATANEAFYECGTYYHIRVYGNPKSGWERVDTDQWQCRSAFDTAVQLRRENEKLRGENERLRAEINGFLMGDEVQPEETKD